MAPTRNIFSKLWIMFLRKGTNMTQIQRFCKNLKLVVVRQPNIPTVIALWSRIENIQYQLFIFMLPCIAFLLAGPGGIICFSNSVVGWKEMLQNLSRAAPLLFIGYYNTISVFTSSNIEPCYALINSHLVHSIILFPVKCGFHVYFSI